MGLPHVAYHPRPDHEHSRREWLRLVGRLYFIIYRLVIDRLVV